MLNLDHLKDELDEWRLVVWAEGLDKPWHLQPLGCPELAAWAHQAFTDLAKARGTRLPELQCKKWRTEKL